MVPVMSKVRFMKSAVNPVDYPPDDGVEIAIAGRSNAGKSSLLNTVTGHKNLAKVSATPGKTRLLNFFEFKENYRWVDLPGYGYAARSGDEMSGWGEMIETYLSQRESLRGLVLVMDIRRKWTDDEAQLKAFCDRMGYSMAIVLAKSDKVTQSEKTKALAAIRRASGVAEVFPVSSLKKQGHVELEEFLYWEWVKPVLEGERP